MHSYRDAGVDLESAERHISAIGSLVTGTWKDQVRGGFGGFAAGVELPPGYDNPVLMMATDGVGTKLELARQSGLWDGVGFDLVAMCVDDLTAVGAKPIGFVDYLAVGALDPERDTTIVGSIARACVAAGCPLLGGETAVHPGVMGRDALDLAGAAMGIVEKGKQFSPEKVRVGDVVIGLESPNLRSNGFSLVRELFTDHIPFRRLLAPSVIYSRSVLRVADRVRSAAHITGGGLPGNLMRAVPDGLGVLIDRSTWEPPPIFRDIEAKGVPVGEMLSTFNMGIGFCLIADEANAAGLLSDLDEHRACTIGSITDSGRFGLV